MTNTLPPKIESAFQGDDAQALEEIIATKQAGDLEVLRVVARNENDTFDSAHRRKALFALGRWGNPDAVSDIVDTLPAMDPASRIAAIDALGRLGGPAATEAVAEYRNDESPQVRKFVVKALERIGTEQTSGLLRAIARNKTEEPWLRRLADDAGARTGH